MKYKHIKGLQYHKVRDLEIDKKKYQDLLDGKDVVLKEEEIESLKDAGVKMRPIETKKKKEGK
tara:strand:+ start:220 stop:408 length:189 start_codon:yes stop_codon:yes gene_type:complete